MMFYKKIKMCFFLMTMAFVISSCESETSISFYIDNMSSSTVTVSGLVVPSNQFNHTIPPQEKERIFGQSSFGIRTKRPEPEFYLGEDFTVTNSKGDTLVKDFRSQSNWTWEMKERKWWVSHEEVMTIADSDF